MNNVFDLKRFGKYFTYDLNNAFNNFGVSALVIGLLPLILLIFNVLFGLVFTGEVPQLALPTKFVLVLIVLVLASLAAPVKLYGSITERRSGSDWLMLPASSFEKFLSMVIMLIIVLPVVLVGLFCLCDLLLSWIVPVYGDSVTRMIFSGAGNFMDMLNASETFITPSGGLATTFMTWCTAILPFGLGAICFKKGKVAKTILCIIALEMLLSLVLAIVFRSGSSWENLDTFFENLTAEKAQFWLNFLINAYYLVVVGGLLAGLFFRVKTIKQ